MIEYHIEKKLGWNRRTEWINAIVCAVRHPLVFAGYWARLLAALLRGRPIVVFTFAMPQYVENLGNVPWRLRDKGWAVFFFPEWRTELFPTYRVDGRGIPVYTHGWYFLPLTFAHLSITPTARKHIYFPRGGPRAHCFHALGSLNAFPADAFTAYDVCFCAGPHHVAELEAYYRARGSKHRVLIPAGYPKLDAHYRAAAERAPAPGGDTIVYCPTYAAPAGSELANCFSSLPTLGIAILEALLPQYRVIFRPHPLNLKHGNIGPLLEAIQTRFGTNPRFRLDTAGSYEASYAESILMVSDTSSTALTYALAYGKPVVFIDGPSDERGVHVEKRGAVGTVVRTVEELAPAVRSLLADPEALRRRLESARRDIVFHFSTSEDAFVEAAEALAAGRVPKNAVTVP